MMLIVMVLLMILRWILYYPLSAASHHHHQHHAIIYNVDFKLSHKDKDDPNFLDLSKDKSYDCIDSEDNPSKLVIYTRRDKSKKKGIKDVQLSFTETEELRLFTDQYEKIGKMLIMRIVVIV